MYMCTNTELIRTIFDKINMYIPQTIIDTWTAMPPSPPPPQTVGLMAWFSQHLFDCSQDITLRSQQVWHAWKLYKLIEYLAGSRCLVWIRLLMLLTSWVTSDVVTEIDTQPSTALIHMHMYKTTCTLWNTHVPFCAVSKFYISKLQQPC